ncbi:MBL fold metallo-hydrolase [Aestuariibius sp. 2305UL40-4]|uniref:MBL fold metallo-hydrolase n=1 Tax=Aestuariibius violaceus TaxID=3234132 RepID=UPI00345EFD7A
MLSDRLVLLGTKGGPAIRAGGPNPTSHLLVMDGRPFVIDCGLGVTRGLVEAGLELRDLRTVLITHLHSDHVLELGPLIHTAWTAGLSHEVEVWGPVGSAAYWDGFCASMAFDMGLRVADEGRPPLGEMVRVREFSEGPLALDGVKASALRVAHPPVTECFALRLEVPGWSIVFGADTAYFPPLAAFATGADLLVHEAMLMAGVDALCARVGNAERLKAHLLASHTPLEDAIRIVQEAGVGQLVLNHLVPCDLPGYGRDVWEAAAGAAWPGGPVLVGYDGLTLERAA